MILSYNTIIFTIILYFILTYFTLSIYKYDVYAAHVIKTNAQFFLSLRKYIDL